MIKVYLTAEEIAELHALLSDAKKKTDMDTKAFQELKGKFDQLAMM